MIIGVFCAAVGVLFLGVPDNWNFNASNPCLHVGGNYNQSLNHGLFYVNYNTASNANSNIGSRLLDVWLTIPSMDESECFSIHGAEGRTPLGEDKPAGHGQVLSKERRKAHEATGGKLKRVRNLYGKLVSDENLRQALLEVNLTHRWYPRHRPNRTVRWVEMDIDSRVCELRRIINGMIEGSMHLSTPKKKRRWDKSAGKWRDINEPRLWPDQYVHHALVQVLQPVMMRGMDPHCCGSIRGRGIHYGMQCIKKWMKNDRRGTKYCLELDIRHFYDSISPDIVLSRLRCLIKDYRVLRLAEEIVRDGVLIGIYCSQWFANTLLQPLDHIIRESGLCAHYLRYMDNFTIFGSNKRKLHRLRCMIGAWLHGVRLRIKENWQVFPTKSRLPTALGYRYGRGYTLLRKRNLLRLKRMLARYYRKRHASVRVAAGLLSRLGQMRHCNGAAILQRIYRRGTQKTLKDAIRAYARKEKAKWNTYSAAMTGAANALC